MESVRAEMIFFWISGGVSVIRILERRSAWDFDILRWGSWRDITLLAGAGRCQILFSFVYFSSPFCGEERVRLEPYIEWYSAPQDADHKHG